MRIIALTVALGTVYAVALPGQQPRMSAREIFYTGPSMAARKQSTTAKAVKSARKAPVEVASRTEPAKAVTLPPGETKAAVPAQTAKEQNYVAAAYPAVEASRNDYPLGLRYSILKKTASGGMEEVAPGHVFVAGDRIRLSVEGNDDGFLYVVHRGSSGIWKPLFPSPDVEGGDNRVRGGVRYEIPPGHVFTFDEQAGKEKLFIVFSRRPEDDLERLIYDLQSGAGPQQTIPAAPGPTVPGRINPPTKILLADSRIRIQDSLVEQLRAVYARDLIVEKVNDQAAGPKKETAVYVVTPPGATGRRVVADIDLDHR